MKSLFYCHLNFKVIGYLQISVLTTYFRTITFQQDEMYKFFRAFNLYINCERQNTHPLKESYSYRERKFSHSRPAGRWLQLLPCLTFACTYLHFLLRILCKHNQRFNALWRSSGEEFAGKEGEKKTGCTRRSRNLTIIRSRYNLSLCCSTYG